MRGTGREFFISHCHSYFETDGIGKLYILPAPGGGPPFPVSFLPDANFRGTTVISAKGRPVVGGTKKRNVL